MKRRHIIEYIDRGGMPSKPSNALFPNGVDLDLSKGAVSACLVKLPYPTKPQLGLFIITCTECGLTAAVTTAGRRDDPRSIKLACEVQP